MKLHDDIEARFKDDIRIRFIVRDKLGSAVNIDGATATYRVSQKDSQSSVLELTESDGITLSGSTASVEFNTEDLSAAGKFWDQLRITKDGKPMVVAEGELIIMPLIE